MMCAFSVGAQAKDYVLEDWDGPAPVQSWLTNPNLDVNGWQPAVSDPASFATSLGPTSWSPRGLYATSHLSIFAQPGTADLANEVFGLGARIGVPGEFLGGLADSVQAPRFATVTGLVQYGAHRVAIGTQPGKGKRLSFANAGPSMDNLAARFKTWLQDFF